MFNWHESKVDKENDYCEMIPRNMIPKIFTFHIFRKYQDFKFYIWLKH